MTNERKSIEWESLVGEHELTGVDGDTIRVKPWEDASYDEPAEVLRFILDGVTYEAIESPGDGYRNSMEGCYVTEAPVRKRVRAGQGGRSHPHQGRIQRHG